MITPINTNYHFLLDYFIIKYKYCQNIHVNIEKSYNLQSTIKFMRNVSI